MKTHLAYRPCLLMIATMTLLGACNREAPPEPGTQTTDPPAADATRQAEQTIRAPDLMRAIEILSSDDFGGRAPMSDGEAKTLDFLESEFTAIGLQPLFDGSYRQAVPLVSIEADPGTASMQFVGESGLRQLAYADEMVTWTSRVTEHVDVDSSELVFVGYGIRAPEYGWDDYAGMDVRGKTVLMLVNDPGYAQPDSELFNGKAMTYYGRWTYKYEEAARQGAAGAIIIHETGAAAYPWQTVRNSWTGPLLHLDREGGNADRVLFESWIPRAVAEELLGASGHELRQLEQQALTREFTPLALPWRVGVRIDNTLNTSVSYNLGGILPGSQRPDEAFVYTAHWDHLGTGVPEYPGQDVIFNGASDNGSGLAGMLALARAFVALPTAPARSTVFLAVTAEESGLLGSSWYAQHPQIPMQKTVAGLNMDNINVYGPTADITLVGYGNSELDDIIRKHAAAMNREVRPEPSPEKGRFYRSDHFNFAKQGVPMLNPKPGTQHLSLGAEYMQQQDRDYYSQRYHTPEDEILDSWDLDGLVLDLQLYFRLGLDVADGQAWPEWSEGNEFRLIRKRSLAGDAIEK